MAASKQPESKSAKASKAPKSSSPDKLTQTTKRAEVELSEDDLGKVSGGVAGPIKTSLKI